MPLRKLTQAEKEEKDFKQLSILLLRMVAQAHKNPKQLRRLKTWQHSLTMFIEELDEKWLTKEVAK
jgi:hypothetical protein|tara:strand:+ start:212 stop:409 length:198 start_codon:yes stop_codon:yes gene_type:complete